MAASVWTVSVLVALALLKGEACIVMQRSDIRMKPSKIISIEASPFMGLTTLVQDLAFGFRLSCLVMHVVLHRWQSAVVSPLDNHLRSSALQVTLPQQDGQRGCCSSSWSPWVLARPLAW